MLDRHWVLVGCLLLPLGGACTPTPSEVQPTTVGGSAGSDTTDGPTTNDDSGGETEGETDNTTDPTGPECGDGIIEGDEECDQGDANGPGKACRGNCMVNVCGDGDVGPGEACDDGNQIDDDDCTNDCGPTSCGDGMIQPPEQCDDGANNSQSGNCLPSCIAASCGDSFINLAGGEVCDGTNTGAEDCMSQGFDDGTLECTKDCAAFDTSNCFVCGNNTVEPNEDCDGPDFDGLTCVDFAPPMTMHSGGNLACQGDCTINSNACTFCGDDVQEGTEECDGNDFNGQSCGTFAPGGTTPSGGAVACGNDCTANEGTCTYCGDDLQEGTEECDGVDLGGNSCPAALPQGGLVCTGACAIDDTGCYNCGNGSIEGPEMCDGANLNGMTCDDINPAFGLTGLACAASCLQFDLTACCLDDGQPCTGDDDCCNTNCNNGSGMCT